MNKPPKNNLKNQSPLPLVHSAPKKCWSSWPGGGARSQPFTRPLHTHVADTKDYIRKLRSRLREPLATGLFGPWAQGRRLPLAKTHGVAIGAGHSQGVSQETCTRPRELQPQLHTVSIRADDDTTPISARGGANSAKPPKSKNFGYQCQFVGQIGITIVRVRIKMCSV